MTRLHTGESGAAAGARIAALEGEVGQLKAQLRRLTQAAARNEALLRKAQNRELELLRAGSLVQLIEELIHGLKDAYQLDAVALLLHDPEHEIRHLLAIDGLQSDALADVQFLDTLDGLAAQFAGRDRPWLGPYGAGDHGTLLPRASRFASIALIPLYRGPQLEGALVFGSSSATRFTPALASDFLEHLGVIAGVCIENAVNRARLVRSGLTDFLTGFHNRRYLQERLTEELARAQRARQAVACLMIDVDHFKRFNDRYGHLAGDAVLREVALRIDAQMRMSDTGARFGGDEFAIVLPNGGAAEASTLAQRVLEDVRATPIPVGAGVAETATLSIGVAVATPALDARDIGSLAQRLVAAADAALYRAKQAGRNGIAVAEDTVS